jgi:hypothetical protein
MGEALKDVPVTDFNQPAPLKPVADELDRQARGGIDPGYRRYPDQTDTGGKFEQGFLSYLRSEGSAILDAIRTEKAISDDTRGKLTAALDSFAKSFS